MKNLPTLRVYKIEYFFVLFNNFAAERLLDAIVRVGHDADTVNNPVFGTVSMDQIEAGQKIEFSCCLKGTFISVNFPSAKEEFLQICEVRAFAGESITRSKSVIFLLACLVK